MEILKDKELWNKIYSLSASSTHRQCAVAYVTNTEAVEFSRGDLLITDASTESVMCGRTSAKRLEELYNRGVTLYNCANLHAKIYVFDDGIIIGSCNLSSRSMNSLIEVAAATSDPRATQDARLIITDIANKSDLISDTPIKELLALPVKNSDSPTDQKTIPPTKEIWRLAKPPTAISSDMKCYFHALITAQIGGLIQHRTFTLWPSPDGKEPFKQHMRGKLGDKERLTKNAMGYALTEEGVQHFSKRKLDKSKIYAFQSAILSGNSEQLPESVKNRKMVRLI